MVSLRVPHCSSNILRQKPWTHWVNDSWSYVTHWLDTPPRTASWGQCTLCLTCTSTLPPPSETYTLIFCFYLGGVNCGSVPSFWHLFFVSIFLTLMFLGRGHHYRPRTNYLNYFCIIFWTFYEFLWFEENCLYLTHVLALNLLL